MEKEFQYREAKHGIQTTEVNPHTLKQSKFAITVRHFLKATSPKQKPVIRGQILESQSSIFSVN